MKGKYIIGVDPATPKSKGSMVVMKHTESGVELVKTIKWYNRFDWVNRLRYKLVIWRFYFRYFRKVEVYKETNNSVVNEKDPYQIQQEIYLSIFPDKYCQILEKMIKYEFPNIKNLSVKRSGQLTISVDFDKGEYTKEEVELKIKEYRDNKNKLIIE